MDLPQHAKNAGDVLSGVLVVSTLTQWLPPVAALLTIIWTLMRIYDWIRNKVNPKE